MAIAARRAGLEAKPALDEPIASLASSPSAGAKPVGATSRQLALEHRADFVLALERLDVPGEGDEVAPIAVILELVDRPADVAGGKGRVEGVQQSRQLGGGCGVEHGCSSGALGRLAAQLTCYRDVPRLGQLANRRNLRWHKHCRAACAGSH